MRGQPPRLRPVGGQGEGSQHAWLRAGAPLLVQAEVSA
jgi:hypothetical protein